MTYLVSYAVQATGLRKEIQILKLGEVARDSGAHRASIAIQLQCTEGVPTFLLLPAVVIGLRQHEAPLYCARSVRPERKPCSFGDCTRRRNSRIRAMTSRSISSRI